MVAECFDTALVILAGVALRKRAHTHAAQSPGHHRYIPFEHSAFYLFQNFPLLLS